MKTLTEHVYIWGFFVFVLQDILKSILTLFFVSVKVQLL